MQASVLSLSNCPIMHRTLKGELRGGVLNFELGTDVRPEVSTTTL